ncbi:phenylacetate--CoA ligase family protein, partial [Micromonospora sp. WMMD736]|uniref:phenylacetate--CoA ligase family protein n=1 Tax=Micromonospora sp. WMMD736 TaxID=3404112 RepID=UPI003B95E7C2
LNWTAEQIAFAQRDGLQTLLRHAAEHSPFHRKRLAGMDIATISPDDLSALPVMTKAQMMAELDDVFTDRRLSQAAVESALAATGTEPVPILGDYIALASGGCSGQRATFVLDRTAVSTFTASVLRESGPADPIAEAPGGQPLMAFVSSPSAVHATGMLAALTSAGAAPVRSGLVPATAALGEIVARLNALQPGVLTGYASMLSRLAAEASGGRLRIAPAMVNSTSETLLPEMRAAIRDAFGVPVVDAFGSTEGLVGKTCPDDDVFVFNTDVCIVELVDSENRPVAPGASSAKVLVTNLYNLTQPLIRYELTDAFVRQPDAKESGYLRARVQGRNDDVLRYGSVEVHPIAIRSVLVTTPQVLDYQVRQTRCGIEVFAVTPEGPHLETLSDRLRRALIDSGLRIPDVAVRPVDGLDRHAVTGKFRRFVPFTGTG